MSKAKLSNKYKKQRKINNAILRKKTKLQKIFSAVFDVLIVFVVFVSLTLCFSIALSRINYTASSYAGFNIFQISSGSMTKSGFYIGDTIIVRSVDTKTLKVGDSIGFYVYQPSYSRFNKLQVRQITEFDNKTHYQTNISQFFGFASKEHKLAGKSGSKIVFHNIISVYEDENGERWFQTQGSSNENADYWKINEKYVIGLYTDSPGSTFTESFLTFLINKNNFMILLLIPFLIFTVVIVFNIIKQIQMVKLELDVVEEKRKITDEICVNNNIGFNMDIKTKYKVLAQAEDKDKNEYMHLLWRSGEIPKEVHKYILKKRISLNYMKAMLDLNRTCENMIKNNENAIKTAKYYLSEKQKIEGLLNTKKHRA